MADVNLSEEWPYYYEVPGALLKITGPWAEIMGLDTRTLRPFARVGREDGYGLAPVSGPLLEYSDG